MSKINSEIPESKKRLKADIKPYAVKIAVLTVLSVAVSLLSVGFAYLTQFLINGASGGDNRLIRLFSVILICVLLARIAIRAINAYLTEKYRAEMAETISEKAFYKALKGKYARLADFHSGEIVNRVLADSREIAADTVSIAPVTAGLAAQLAGCLIALFTTDKLFTLILIVGGGLIFGLSALFKKTLKKYQKEIMSLDGKNKSFLQETISSALTIKAYNAEEKTAEKSKKIMSAYTKKRLDRAKTYSFVNVLYSLISNMGLLFAVVWCAVAVVNGKMEYGAILSVVLLMEQLQRPLTSFASVMPVVYARAASAERLYEIETFEEEKTGEPVVSYDSISGIKFDNVGFSYGRNVVFDDFSAEFRKGDFVCLVGRSGIGKSTLFKLLLAFYKPTSGEIKIISKDGEKPIDETDRGLFAYVPQGNFLFSGTIRENLTFFSGESPSEEELKTALETAVAEFVYDLPDKLETRLTERGGGLSEGQLQRLAVARAVLSGRPILLLDEATSALDEATETELLRRLKLNGERTVIMITHRPAATEICDSVIRLAV